MQRITSTDRDLPAWVERPARWRSGDWAIYQAALHDAQAAGQVYALCQLAGVLALLFNERIRAVVREIELHAADNLLSINWLAARFLRQTVAHSLEQTQRIPFLALRPCAIGMTAWGGTNPARRAI